MFKKAALVFFVSIGFCLSAIAQQDTLVYYIKVFRASETMTFEEPVPIKDKDSADFFRAILPPDTSTDKDYLL